MATVKLLEQGGITETHLHILQAVNKVLEETPGKILPYSTLMEMYRRDRLELELSHEEAIQTLTKSLEGLKRLRRIGREERSN